MPARAHQQQQHASDEGGFVLIEILVSALIVTLVAGAVLTLLTATTHSAADQRTHADAYAVAQEDQARMRTIRISRLNGLKEENSVTLNGTKYTVESRGVFVNSTSGTPSCTSGEASADYVRITSTVRWTNMGNRNPVTIQSIVAPSNGSLDPNHGTLAFSAANAQGLPLAGVSISGSGTANFSGSTDSTGCANFADLPAGNYSVTTSAAGMINMLGEAVTTKTVGVIASGTQTVALRYDLGGKLLMRFQYRVGSSSEFKAATSDSVLVYNAETGQLGQAYWTTGKERKEVVEATPLFPFKNADTVYAGACETNNPVKEGEANPPGAEARASVLIPPGGVAEATIKLPALNLTVKKNSALLSGAKVAITDENCKDAQNNKIRRTYTTNSAGIPASPTGVPEPALPWGTYEICAQTGNGGSTVHKTVTKEKVQNLAAATTLTLDLGSGTQSGGCP